MPEQTPRPALLKTSRIYYVAVPVVLLSLALGQLAHGQAAKAKPGSGAPTTTAVRKLESQAEACRQAKEAVSLYQIYLADDKLPATERREAEVKLREWEKKADEGLVRVGKKWITEDDEKKLRAEADDLVKQAMTLLDARAYKQAEKKLTTASKIYPDHLESVFLLAVGTWLAGNNEAAEKQFAEMLRRAPTNVAVLSNLAVAEAFIGKVERAISHLEKAAKLNPDHGPTIQNLGALVKHLENPRPGSKIRGDNKARDRAANVFAAVEHKSKANYDPRKPFLMDFRFSSGADEGESPSTAEGDAVVGNGSGFVIADGYILTNKHVVDDADGLGIVDPADSKRILKGEVVGIAEGMDVALVRCPELKSQPVLFGDKDLSRGSEVMALGFPLTNVVGTGLKATRGIVTGLPSVDTDNMMVLDVQINPGNSGGPLCDAYGQVVGINTAVTYSSRFIQGYGLALPIARAVPFIQKYLPDFQVKPSEASKKEWTEVDAAVSPSTVMILIRKKVGGTVATKK